MPRGQYERKKKTNSAIAYEVEQNKEKTELVENLYDQVHNLEYKLESRNAEIIKLKEELLGCYRKLSPGC